MLKYKGYIKENAGGGVSKTFKYKRGDYFVYNSNNTRTDYYHKRDGQKCKINIVWEGKNRLTNPDLDYQVEFEDGTLVSVNENELSPIEQENNTSNYIENQFNQNGKISVGSRVSVTGSDGPIDYNNDKGTVLRITADDYFIKFDDDDANNKAGFTELVNKKIVTLLDDKPVSNYYKIGDNVQCIDPKSEFYNKEGKVVNRWEEDDSYMVEFIDNYGLVTMFMLGVKLKKSEKPARKIGFQTSTPPVATTPKKPVTVYEEEDEDGDIIVAKPAVPLKKEDLMEFSYKDFFEDQDRISTADDLKKNKVNFEKQLENPDIQKVKKIFIERSIATIEIIESYFQFLINKVAEGLPVLRTVEQITDEDVIKNKTKVRASDSKELTRKYSFDQGIIVYWKFKDAVVFKTI